jgi:hypothetical protein
MSETETSKLVTMVAKTTHRCRYCKRWIRKDVDMQALEFVSQDWWHVRCVKKHLKFMGNIKGPRTHVAT